MHVRFGYLLFGSVLAVSSVCTVVACTAALPKNAPLALRDSGGDDGTQTDPNTGDTQLGEADKPLSDGGKPPGKIYVHTGATLFLFDPLAAGGAGTLTEIGAFDCLAAENDTMIDIAVDRSNNIYGTSFNGFLKISATDAKCTYILKAGSYPNSLAFMPIGTVDMTQEALVGYGFDAVNQATQFERIDTTTGKVTVIGNINPPDVSGQGTQYEASGDIIGLSRNGNSAYVTVKQLPPDGGVATILTDSLAEVNPATGAIKSVKRETGEIDLYGLGQWAGQAYGFSGDTGDIVKIDLARGTSEIVAVDAGSPVLWYGAGVTTLAPTKP